MRNHWIFNAIFAVAAAVFAILQEKWLGNPIVFLNAFGLAASCGVGFSVCVEIVKSLIKYHEWSWRNVGIGAAAGIVAAVIAALAL